VISFCVCILFVFSLSNTNNLYFSVFLFLQNHCPDALLRWTTTPNSKQQRTKKTHTGTHSRTHAHTQPEQEQQKLCTGVIPSHANEDTLCSVCCDGDSTNDNEILFCERCDLAVHQVGPSCFVVQMGLLCLCFLSFYNDDDGGEDDDFSYTLKS